MTLDLPGLLGVLVCNDVRFVTVGAFAVSVHGHPRMTADLDIVPDPASDNIARLAAALTQLEATIPSGKRFDPDLHGRALHRGGNATLSTRSGPLDIVQRLAGVPGYEELLAHAVEVTLAGLTVDVCSLADLRAMKEAAGRPQDLADLANLPLADEM